MVFLLSLGLFQWQGVGLPVWLLLSAQALIAIGFSRLLGLSVGWGWVQAIFPFALYAGLVAPVPAWVWLAIAVVIALVYRNVLKDRVPLYLSNRTTWEAVTDLVPADKAVTVMDMGCGFGGILAHLADHRPNARLIGVESAPLVALLAKLRFQWGRHKDVTIIYGDLWDQDIASVDLIYCFLSPVPMPKLFEKVREAARDHAMTLISNSFDVPGHDAHRELILSDDRQTRLLIWQWPETDHENLPRP